MTLVLNEGKMGLTIQDAIPDSSPLVVQGAGALAATALMAAGRMDASMAIVEPVSGSTTLDQRPDQVLSVPDPSLKLEKPSGPNRTVQDPTMNGPSW